MWTGDATSSPFYTNEIIRRAIVVRASYLYVMHNHPVGGAMPSRQDIIVTKNLRHATETVQMGLLDHVIVAPGGERYSLRQAGVLRGSVDRLEPYVQPERFAQMAIEALTARSTVYPQYGPVLQSHGWIIALAIFKSKRSVAAKELPLMTHVPYTSVLRHLAALREVGLATLTKKGAANRQISADLTELGKSVINEIILACC